MKSKNFLAVLLSVLTFLSCMTIMSASAKEWEKDGVEFFYSVDIDNNASIEDIFNFVR